MFHLLSDVSIQDRTIFTQQDPSLVTMRPVVSTAQSMQYLESQADCNWVHDKSEQTQPAELTIVSKVSHTSAGRPEQCCKCHTRYVLRQRLHDIQLTDERLLGLTGFTSVSSLVERPLFVDDLVAGTFRLASRFFDSSIRKLALFAVRT